MGYAPPVVSRRQQHGHEVKSVVREKEDSVKKIGVSQWATASANLSDGVSD